ncbi:MAG: phosphotransferase, partial [Planctomycetota bacterium]
MNVLAAMSEPTTYPHQVDRIRHLETHISHVFLTGEFAYKLKKPLQNPFLDYRTLEARKRYCAQELELNRRFSPELYVGVVAIAKDANGWNLEGRGEIVEYAVKMREFSQDELLLSQLRSGKLTEEQVRSLGAELAAIHQAAPRLPDLSAAYGSPSVVAEESRDNVRALRQLAPEAQRGLVEELAAEIEQQLQKLEPVFAERRARGFIRECHGDLHLGNLIWRAGRVQLFDGIEFNESFRWIDLMSDLGFVLMDLEEHRQPGLANLLLNVYLEASGDFGGLQVLNFYKVYRALVRAKVAALRANQQVSQSRAHSWEEVVEYLEYAAAAFVVRHPRLILTHG